MLSIFHDFPMRDESSKTDFHFYAMYDVYILRSIDRANFT